MEKACKLIFVRRTLDMDQWLADKQHDTGHYCRLMLEHVKKVLADPKRVVPEYDASQGSELAGFVWLQGFDDMVDGHVNEFEDNVVAVQTAPFWSEELDAIDQKHGQVRQMNYFLDSKHKDYANVDGSMTAEQKREYLKKFEAELISPADVALWKCGASNAVYHYLGCAKTFTLMGRAFAEATLAMQKDP